MIDQPCGMIDGRRSPSVQAMVFGQCLLDLVFTHIPNRSSAPLEEQNFCLRLDSPDPACVLTDFQIAIACVAGTGMMQGMIRKIVSCSDGGGPVGLIINEVKAQLVVPPPCVNPPGSVDSPLGHERNREACLTTKRIITADGKSSYLVTFPFADARITWSPVRRLDCNRSRYGKKSDLLPHRFCSIQAGFDHAEGTC